MSENFIFIYLGLTIFTKEDEVFHWGLIIFTMLFILVARALSVFPLARLINNLERAKRVGVWQYIKARLRPRNDFSIHILESANSEPDTISKPHQVMLWWAGLRGAIAFALSLDMKTPSAMEVRTTTLVVVISSIVLLGGSTVFALKRLRIQMNEKAISSPVSVCLFRDMLILLYIAGEELV